MRLRQFNTESLKVSEKITTFAQVQNYKNMISTLIYEEWKPVPNYEGLYDASNFGRIRSLDRWRDNGTGRYIQKGRILKPGKNSKGYLTVILCKDRKKKTFLVHRLVWETFNSEIPECMQVNHINEIKTDNSVWNLNLMTNQENCNWGRHNLNVSKSKINGGKTCCVLQLTLDDVLVKEWSSMAEAERNGFKNGCISLCCQGKQKTHKGFKWRKKESVL